MNVNPELRELQRQRDALVEKIHQAREQIRNAEMNPSKKRRISFDKLPHLPENLENKHLDWPMNLDGLDSDNILQEVKMIELVTGIKYRNGIETWCHDDVYSYKADVITRAVQFTIQTTYERKEKQLVRILNIECHFTDISESCVQEMFPWIEDCTRNKTFSLFTLALSDYDDHSVNRVKILSALKSKEYVILEKCKDKEGGIFVSTHPHKIPKKVYFKIRWSLKFSKNLLKVRDIFAIERVMAGEAFMKNNNNLLEKFHNIEKNGWNIRELWEKLCEAIDNDNS